MPVTSESIGQQIGECREGPPGIEVLVATNEQGHITRVGQFHEYPLLPPDFRACSRFDPRSPKLITET